MLRVVKALKLYCTIHDITQAQLSTTIGITESTLSRLLQGHDMSHGSFVKLLNWMLQEEGDLYGTKRNRKKPATVNTPRTEQDRSQ